MSDISKLTVAKLKSLCKENGLTGYSKLTKSALLEKLGVLTNDAIPTTNLKSSSPTKAKGNSKEYIDSSKLADSPTKTSSLAETLSRPGAVTSIHPPPRDLFFEGIDHEPHTQENLNATRASSLSTFTAGPTMDIGLSASSGYKRSADVVSLNEIPIKPSKRLKKHTSPLGTQHGFKVPQIPHREAEIPLSTHDASVCAARARHSMFRAQHYANASPNSSNPRISLASSSSSEDQVCRQGHILATSVSLYDSNDIHRRHLHQNIWSKGSHPSTNSLQTRDPPRSTVNMQTISSTVPPQTPCTPSASYDFQPPSRPQKHRFVAPRPTSNPHTRPPSDTSIPLPRQWDLAFLNTSVPQSLETAILNNVRHITVPPSISQRKRLPMISIALSGLDDAERMICVRVSKLFRYAVYVSAQHILSRWFAGERLARLFNGISSRGLSLSMSNLWPYLRLREQEASQRKKEFEESWVPKILREWGGNRDLNASMSQKLWASPDFDEQFSVVFRFIQTRICFALAHRALGDTVLKWVTSTVVDAQPVLENEIWSITVVSTDMGHKGRHPGEDTFYVLYQTCEVIGHPPDSISTAPPSSKDCRPLDSGEARISHIHLRADWSSYIALRLPTATQHLHPPLIKHVRDTNPDDFDHGVARVWLKRMNGQGEEGKLKKQVAEKYIFGCVLGNCVSGEYKSTTQMALEFAGIPECKETFRCRNNDAPKVNMLIPEQVRHNVESVHFTKPGGLHPALAVVQVAGRQEGTFVLKENGLTIGEDEKVPEVWMKLLGCSETGVSIGEQ